MRPNPILQPAANTKNDETGHAPTDSLDNIVSSILQASQRCEKPHTENTLKVSVSSDIVCCYFSVV